MNVILRAGTPADAAACGAICFEAFKSISSEHNFPWDLPVGGNRHRAASRMLLAHPGFYAVVAEADGRIVGSNFMDERGPIAGIGPITVDPAAQNHGDRPPVDARHARSRRASGASPGSGWCNPPITTARCASTRSSASTAARRCRKSTEQPLGIRLPGYDVRPAVDGGSAMRATRCAAGSTGTTAAASCTMRSAAARPGSSSILGEITAYCHRHRLFRSRRRRDQSWAQGIDRRRIGFPGRRISRADAQQRAVSLVPAARSAPRAPDDLDDDRPLQRAGGRLPAVGALLTSMASPHCGANHGICG